MMNNKVVGALLLVTLCMVFTVLLGSSYIRTLPGQSATHDVSLLQCSWVCTYYIAYFSFVWTHKDLPVKSHDYTSNMHAADTYTIVTFHWSPHFMLQDKTAICYVCILSQIETCSESITCQFNSQTLQNTL